MLAAASSLNPLVGVVIIDGPKHGGRIMTGELSKRRLTWYGVKFLMGRTTFPSRTRVCAGATAPVQQISAAVRVTIGREGSRMGSRAGTIICSEGGSFSLSRVGVSPSDTVSKIF